ncbi:hypothetical protein QBC40DRAFT_342359 [Triangularia verruculosa]|uniref:DUF7726 domain-containing protein n=1 Tax=Triangularia verruculosa TaxID=2587418 RepID=A0AAN7ARS4_9PEZI|nr:hypothetical protein QBC40DRAFT_342359 [Triangularia verruculosa]
MSGWVYRPALGPPPTSNPPAGVMPISALLSPQPDADKENMMPAPSKSLKRKSLDDHAVAPTSAGHGLSLDDIDLEGATIDMNCDQVRRKINNLLDSNAMTKTAFAREIGVSAKSLSGFLGVHGPMNGSGFAAYDSAWEWFKKREMLGIPLPVGKKQKTTTASVAASAPAATGTSSASAPKTKTPASATPDISSITLPGEETDSVPVFDSCDEMRRKINLHLKKDGVTQASFLRDIYAQLHGPSKPGKCFQSVQLQRFRGMKGSNCGAKSALYYGAYVFFEKIRIKEGKPKTKHRLEMEQLWGPGGADREHDGNSRVWVLDVKRGGGGRGGAGRGMGYAYF